MKKSKTVKVTAMVMSAIIAASTFISYFSPLASAELSLQHIEEIKQRLQKSGESYHIVEVAPSLDSGTIGYYADGQEPGPAGNWKDHIANMALSSERVSYANRVFEKLGNFGLLRATDTNPAPPDIEKESTPLRKIGDYEEHLPWEEGFNPEDYNTINLVNPEEIKINGKVEMLEDDESDSGEYNAEYNYYLPQEGKNFFDASAWYSNTNNGGQQDFHQFDHASDANLGIIAGSNSVTLSDINTTTPGDAISYMKHMGSGTNSSLIELEGGYVYTLSFNLKITPSASAELIAAIRLWGYDADGNAVDIGGESEKEFNNNGLKNMTFTAPANLRSIEINFGARGKGEIEFGKITLIKSRAEYVQDISYFEYGLADKVVSGDNLFEFDKWSNNESSTSLVHKTDVDTIESDSVTKSVRVRTDDQGSYDVYSAYGQSFSYYYMNVKPDTEYEISYDLTVTKGSGQVYVFPYRDGMTCQQNPNAGATWPYITYDSKPNGDWKLGMINSSTGRYTKRFTTDDTVLYLQIRVGGSYSASDVTFSNIQIREVTRPKFYYYDVTVHSEHKYVENQPYVYPYIGAAVYTKDSEGHYQYEGTYTGEYGGDFSGFDTTKTYYTLDIASEPALTFDDEHPYKAYAGGFRKAGKYIQFTSGGKLYFAAVDEDDIPGIESEYQTSVTVKGDETPYFIGELSKLTYVGSGGNSHFTPDTSEKEVTVSLPKAFYTGGFINNNWFKNYVLEAEEPKYTFGIKVTVVTPDSPDLRGAILDADLIVFTSGLDIMSAGSEAEGTVDGEIRYTSDIGNDSIEEIKSVLENYKNNKMPIMVDREIVDGNVADGAPNLKSACADILGNLATGGVGKDGGNVYAFCADDIQINEAAKKSIANEWFLKKDCVDSFASPTNPTTEPYKPVQTEIINENGIRPGYSDDLKQSRVTEATTLRYIINYKHPRLYNSVFGRELQVLDIEPMSSKATLKVSDVRGLLPNTDEFNALADKDIKITAMSAAEFVACNEDFSEKYDIIYIGASTKNMNVVTNNCSFKYKYYTDAEHKDDNHIATDTCKFVNGEPSGEEGERYNNRSKNNLLVGPTLEVGDPIYNDINMQGMYYTNVGDTIVTSQDSSFENRPELGGLLGEDYKNYWTAAGETTLLGMNIGSAVQGAANAVGLGTTLKTTYRVKDKTSTVRSSGTDINEAAMERLLDFANSGRPVIVSEKLSKTLYGKAKIKLTASQKNWSNDIGYQVHLTGAVTFNGQEDPEANAIMQDLPKWIYWEYKNSNGQWVTYKTGRTAADLNDIPTPDNAMPVGNLRKVANSEYKYDYDLLSKDHKGEFRCRVKFQYGEDYFDVTSNVYEVTKSATFRRSYLGLCQPGGAGNDFRMNLRNGNLGIDGEDYDYYYNNFQSKVTPRFLDLYYSWDVKSWGSWDNNVSNNSGYNHRLWTVRLGEGTKFKLKNSNSSSSYVNFEVLRTSLDDSKDLDVTTPETGTKKTTLVDNEDKNKRCWIWIPTFNFADSVDMPLSQVRLGSELLSKKFDNTSYMWRFLSNVFYTMPNVMSADDAKVYADPENNDESTPLLDALHICNPEIELLDDVPEYPDTLPDNNTLSFKFVVHDESNTDRENEQYVGKFYVDINSDGKFTENEIAVRNIGPIGVDQEKTFSYTFLNDNIRLQPWKLVMEEQLTPEEKEKGKVAGHASYSGYAYIKTFKSIDIKAIMILPGAWASHHYYKNNKLVTDTYDEDGNFVNNHYKNFKTEVLNKKTQIMGQTKIITHDNQYQSNQYIGCVFESDIFDTEALTGENHEKLRRLTMQELGVDRAGIGSDGLRHIGFEINGGDIKIDIALWDIHQMNNYFNPDGVQGNDDDKSYEEVKTKFAAYNMMILGFADSWGKLASTQIDMIVNRETLEGLELRSAQAIEYFINSGRATVFCHDTTNRSNVFINYWANDIANKFTEAFSNVMGFGNKILNWFGIDDYFDTLSDSSFLKSSRVKQGYYNNLVLREALGFDRYGITYAINQRAIAISDGKDTYVKEEFGTVFTNHDQYGNALGAAIYIPSEETNDIIYGYQYAKDANGRNVLSVENMLTYRDSMGVTHNHSIAYVPGSADTMEQRDNGLPYKTKNNAVKLTRTLVTNRDGISTYHYIAENKTAKVSLGEPELEKSSQMPHILRATDSTSSPTEQLSIGLLKGAKYDKYAQGYTDYTITRYIERNSQLYPSTYLKSLNNTDKSVFETDKITQLNQGRITSYPYDINSSDLDEEKDISPTHEQVYQCNMNGDDITVWYCLSGQNYYNSKTSDGIRNNAANAYYIFSRKNVVYTGAGHTNSFNEFEAQLFINTLVGAYRPRGLAPIADFYDETGETNVNYVYVLEKDGHIVPVYSKPGKPGAIYFKIEDKNLGVQKWPGAKLTYIKYNGQEVPITGNVTFYAGGTTEDGTIVYNSNFGRFGSSTPYVFESNLLYSMTIPQDIETEFLTNSSVNKVVMYLQPATHLQVEGDLSATETEDESLFTGNPVKIEIIKISLSDLG